MEVVSRQKYKEGLNGDGVKTKVQGRTKRRWCQDKSTRKGLNGGGVKTKVQGRTNWILLFIATLHIAVIYQS